MRLIASVLITTLFLAGCAVKGPYGNFVEKPDDLDQQKIASDTVRQLAVLYPPAKTRFELQHPAADPFGQAFVRGLREKGYALLEFDPRTMAKNSTNTDNVIQMPDVTATYALSYVLDQAIDTNLYHVKVVVGEQSIARAYAAGDTSAAPAGYWLHKE